jgi:hypothetical protein
MLSLLLLFFSHGPYLHKHFFYVIAQINNWNEMKLNKAKMRLALE